MKKARTMKTTESPAEDVNCFKIVSPCHFLAAPCIIFTQFHIAVGVLFSFFYVFFSLLASQVDGVVWRIKLHFRTSDAPVFSVLAVHF